MNPLGSLLQKPTTADFFFSPRWLRHSPSPSSPAAQTDVSYIPLNFTTSINGSTNEVQPPVYSDVFPSPNHDDICTQSQHTDLPAASDLSAKKDIFQDKWTGSSLVTLRGQNFVLIVINLPLKLAHLP